MTENKRFTVDKDGRTILDIVDDSYCECVDSYEAKEYCRKLNELNDENTLFKDTLLSAIESERTDLGRRALLNLAANVGVDVP